MAEQDRTRVAHELDAWSPGADSMSRYWIPITVLALGLVSILMLIGTNWIRERLLVNDVALVDALGEIQTREAISHLWLEEYVGGDALHIGQFWQSQARSLILIQAILEGGELPGSRYSLEPVRDPGLRADALAIRDQILEFQEIARRRHEGYERGEDVGIGSAIDEAYDGIFESMLEALRAFEARVDRELDRAHARSSLLFRTMLVAWIAIVGLAVAGLWHRERRQIEAEKTLRLRDAQLQQSQKMEAVGRLAGGMAHDINNYLAAMIAQCELVQLKPHDTGRNLRRMETVIGTASKAATLIQRLLAFSRREVVRPEVVNMNQVFEDLGPMLERLIGEDIEFHTELRADLGNVWIDPAQLEQVIVNLTVNAREAMPVGGRLTIATDERTVGPGSAPPNVDLEPGDYVLLRLSDQGIGIPEEDRQRIFEPFVTTKDKATSSGLGLSTVYGIAQQNGGAIEVKSQVGVGSSFTMYLPRTDAALPARPRKQTTPPRRGTQRILVVEDNAELLETMREALQILGYSVLTAASGREALEGFQSRMHEIDLMISDVVMPGMNGKSLVDALRKIRPELVVIFISGYTDDVMLRNGIAEQEVHFVSKPFSIEKLVGKVQEVVGRAAA